MNPKHFERGLGGLVMKAIRSISAVDDVTAARLTPARWTEVREEFKLHQAVAELICIAGFLLGIFLPGLTSPPLQAWDIGIAFGAMAYLPLLYLLLICWQKGFLTAYRRLADYQTLKYAIPWSVQLWYVYTPMAFAGVACVVLRCCFPVPIK
jgi:hypothetical protein